jgi:hypothetical protein
MRSHGPILALLALLIAAPANAAAKLDTVQDLMQMCRSDNTIAEATDKAICLGWIGGATDVMFALGHKLPGTPWAACASGKFVSFAAMRQAFLNWADQHPKLWTAPALAGLALAIRSTWPCPPR